MPDADFITYASGDAVENVHRMYARLARIVECTPVVEQSARVGRFCDACREDCVQKLSVLRTEGMRGLHLKTHIDAVRNVADAVLGQLHHIRLQYPRAPGRSALFDEHCVTRNIRPIDTRPCTSDRHTARDNVYLHDRDMRVDLTHQVEFLPAQTRSMKSYHTGAHVT